MNVFQAITPRRSGSAVNTEHLPDVNSFVDVAAGGRTENLPIEHLGARTFQVRRPANAMIGARALFNYSNGKGRFRFYAECTEIEDKIATYALPSQITVIEKFGDKRRNYRLRIALSVLWRYAPDGAGYGEFQTTSTVNLSCAGVALVVPRELKPETQLEVKFDLGVSQPFTLIGTLSRSTQRQASGKFVAGLAFKSITPTSANAISEFISSRQQGQRKRSLAGD